MFVDEGKVKILNKSVSSLPNYRLVIGETKEQLKLNLLKECPRSINKLVHRINKREGDKTVAKTEERQEREHWVFGERKVFFWVLIFYSHFHSLPFEELQEQHLLELGQFFPQKSQYFLNYEIRNIIFSLGGMSVGDWSEEEHSLLMDAAGKNAETEQDWRLVALEIYKASEGRFFRSLRDCREHWRNYLNPTLEKRSWSSEEDVELFELVVKHGCKWSLIAKEVNYKRSEHTIKNRFNTFLRHSSSKNTNFNNHIRFAKNQLGILKNKLRRASAKAQNLKLEQEEVQPQANLEVSQKPFFIEEDEENYLDQILDMREEYELCKQERGTADDDDLQLSPPCMGSRAPLPQDPSEQSEEQQRWQEGADLWERQRFEEELAKALGCQHFERLNIISDDQFPQDSNYSYSF